MPQSPQFSVIIPTHNRIALVQRVLRALQSQRCREEFEVIVVADACSDGTVEALRKLRPGLNHPLRVIELDARSASAARNNGARLALADMLLFLDDDVIPDPDWASELVAALEGADAVLGYSKPALPSSPSWWQLEARRWWEDMFTLMRQPGFRFHYRSFFSGNFGIRRAAFIKTGGFDTDMRGRLEDYEFGFRFLTQGCRVAYVHAASGWHHDETHLEKWLHRMHLEGVADVQMAQKHPDLTAGMFSHAALRAPDIKQWLTGAFSQAGNHKAAAKLLTKIRRYEATRKREKYYACLRDLKACHYWSGVAEAVEGNKGKLLAILQEASPSGRVDVQATILELDDLHGMPEHALIKNAANGLILMRHGIELLSIPPSPGAEPLRKHHVQHMLQARLRDHFVPALALDLAPGSEEAHAG